MIKRTITVDIIPTPEEMADIFWTYGSDMQAEFFAALYYRGPDDVARRLMQWEYIRQSNHMTNQARQIMSEIGEYSRRE